MEREEETPPTPGKEAGAMEIPFRFPQYQIQSFLLSCCSILRHPPPWDFLPPDADCRSPVGNESETLYHLRQKYSDEILEGARVVEKTAAGPVRLRPELCNPAGAIVGLRRTPGAWPHGLLTARGCLSESGLLISSALSDARTWAGVNETGLLIAPFRIGEVALLRTLGLPATLCPRPTQLSIDQLRVVDETFGGGDYSPLEHTGEPGESDWAGPESKREHKPEIGERSAPNQNKGSLGTRPPGAPTSAKPERSPCVQTKLTLVLLGWSPRSICATPSPILNRWTSYLTACRRYLGLPFAGVLVWRPSPSFFENLRFRIVRKNVELVQELLRDSLDELHDFEREGDQQQGLGEAVSLLAVQEELQASLAEDRAHGRSSHRVQTALHRYEALVQQDLIAPLYAWAMASDDPVVRNAGVELASVCGLIHRMTPGLHELQRSQLHRALRTEGELIPAALFEQYLKLLNRLGSLMRDLRCWSKWA